MGRVPATNRYRYGAGADLIAWKYRQEYPANAEEAFQTGSDQTFIRSEAVALARKNTIALETQKNAPLILGVDIARGGRDRTRIIDRKGRCLGKIVDETIDSSDEMHIVGVIAKLIDEHQPAVVNIDITGLGCGVYDRLVELGYGGYHGQVNGINFGAKADNEEKYVNKRAEMWAELRDWLQDPAGVDIPDDSALHTQLCAPIWADGATRFDSNSRLLLEAKEHIIKRLRASPDAADAAALTFAVRAVRTKHVPLVYPENHISNNIL